MMTYGVTTRCAHCDSSIVDPTTRVIAGDRVYCCPNCAAALEQRGSGSDPHTLTQAGHLRCSHCGAVIVDESTMTTYDEQAYCCLNCQRAMEQAPTGTASQLP
jgi:hypothetical protein